MKQSKTALMEPKCFRHPVNPGKHYCSKYNIYLCDDCLACQDPTIYCKFRQMCPIWEIIRHGTPEMQDKALQRDKEKPLVEPKASAVKITFLPANKTIEVETGITIMEAARGEDIYINARCGGKGVCGSCKVRLEKGDPRHEDSPLLNKEDKKLGYLLACKAEITGDTTIRVPDENMERAIKIVEDGAGIKERLLAGHSIKPMVTIVPLELVPPSLDDPSGDLERTRFGLNNAGVKCEEMSISLPALRELSESLRSNNWKVNIALLNRGFATEIIRTTPHNISPKFFGLCVDMGTTSVVAYLVDLATADVIGVTSTQNRQVVCGEDVISRIICAQGEGGLERFHMYAIKTINELINELVTVSNIKRDDILSFAIAGNTVMTQSVLKLDPGSIRVEPYVPVAIEFPVLHAEDIDLAIHPRAGVFVVPGNAAYVGGDITAGIIATGLYRNDDTTLFIDVGTNGEMALGNKDWMMTASCSAGPAFEGGGIRHGMRALPGAIDRIEIDHDTLEPVIAVIDDELPIGLCGSGMISLLGSLFLSGIIDSSGKLNDGFSTNRVREGNFGKEYVVVWQKDSNREDDIIITEVDISTLLKSKAAVYAGIMTLIKNAGVTMDMIDHIQLAGGFGKYIDFEMAIVLGMLPDVDVNRFEYMGNSSITGVYLALIYEDIRKKMIDVSRSMTYIDFSSSNLFYDEYVQAMFLPHTDSRSFPGVQKKLEGRDKRR